MQSFSSSVGRVVGLTSRCVPLAEGLAEATAQLYDGQIVARDGNSTHGMIDYDGLLVLPGIIGLHDGAFEHAVMSRPGVAFPYEIALADVDGRLLARGITTELHGVTYSWGGSLRGHTYAVRMLDMPDAIHPHLGTQHLMHLHFGLHYADGVADALTWMGAGYMHFLSFDDHLLMMCDRLGGARKLVQYADRVECDIGIFLVRLNAIAADAMRLNEVTDTFAWVAQQCDICMTSHDEPDIAIYNTFHAYDYTATEFPLTEDAARVARAHGGHTVFGAPNVVRGGSYHGAPNASIVVAAGLGTVLVFDYYYPVLLAVPLELAERGVVLLIEVWALVVANLAETVGLTDRDVLAPGLRVDAIVADDRRPGLPRMVAAVMGGRLRHATDQLSLIG